MLGVYVFHGPYRKKAPSIFEIKEIKKVSQHSLMEMAPGKGSKREVKFHIRDQPAIEIYFSRCTQMGIKSNLQALNTLLVQPLYRFREERDL
jgi:hypothetical protein